MDQRLSTQITVAMAAFEVAKAPYILMTPGLGSCIGLCIYDPIKKVAGMAHIMLPTFAKGAGNDIPKYADTAIRAMIPRILDSGACKNNLKAKMAGGAQMFNFPDRPTLLKVGERNVEAVKEELTAQNIPLVAEDVGGHFGRTIFFEIETGNLRIRTINHGEKII